MEHTYKRIERRILLAIVQIISRMIRADRRLDAGELHKLIALESKFGFNRTLMAEASHLTLFESVSRLGELNTEVLDDLIASLTSLAMADKVCDMHEALLLLGIRYSLSQTDTTRSRIITCPAIDHSLDFCGCILYIESSVNAAMHNSLNRQWELMQLLAQSHGLQMMYVEKLVENIRHMDEQIVKTLLGYMAPLMTDGQIDSFYHRIQDIDSHTFCERILTDTLHIDTLRDTAPALLIGLGWKDFLYLPISDSPESTLRRFLNDYASVVTPDRSTSPSSAGSTHLLFDGYGKLFFSLMVKAEPMKSSMLIWPNKSEFEFPDASRILRLNQQEASLYTLILICGLGNGKGLPLSYTANQKNIERLYKAIYCRKKFIDSADVEFPENLAPIRARIEKKMREQLAGLDNLDEFIPYNTNRDGYYSIAASDSMLMVKADVSTEAIPLDKYRWEDL